MLKICPLHWMVKGVWELLLWHWTTFVNWFMLSSFAITFCVYVLSKQRCRVFFSPLVRMMQVNACSVYVFGSKWRIASLNHHLLDNSFLRCICSHDLFVLTHIDPPTIITMVPFHGNALLVTYFSILHLVWLNLIYPHKLSLLMKCSFHLKLSLMLVLLLLSLHLE